VSILGDAEALQAKRRLGEQQIKLFDWSRTAHSTLGVYRAALTG